MFRAEPGEEPTLTVWTDGQIGRAKGRWVWGQFSPFIPHKDLMLLIQKARAEGTFLVEPSQKGEG